MDPDPTRYFGRHNRDPVPRGRISGAWRTPDRIDDTTRDDILFWAGIVCVVLGVAALVVWAVTEVTTP